MFKRKSKTPPPTPSPLEQAWLSWILSQQAEFLETGTFNGDETYHRACFNAGYQAGLQDKGRNV